MSWKIVLYNMTMSEWHQLSCHMRVTFINKFRLRIYAIRQQKHWRIQRACLGEQHPLPLSFLPFFLHLPFPFPSHKKIIPFPPSASSVSFTWQNMDNTKLGHEAHWYYFLIILFIFIFKVSDGQQWISNRPIQRVWSIQRSPKFNL